MKKMKKLLCMILALMFVLSLATTALADSKEVSQSTDTANAEVTATASKTGDDILTGTAVYKLTISWEVTSGSITVGADTYGWNPETHKYDVQTPVTTYEVKDSASISVTVTNHSNAAMKVTLSEGEGSHFSFAEGATLSATLLSAAGAIADKSTAGKAVIYDTTLKNISLVLDSTGITASSTDGTTAFKIGTVVISVAPAT